MNHSPIVVLKFGSSVLAGVDRVPRAVHAIYRHVQRGERVIAVVSALAGETDQLLGMVDKLDGEADPYRIASFVGTGETKSALLLSIALERVGLTTQLLSPENIGMMAEGVPLDSDPCKVNVGALQELMADEGGKFEELAHRNGLLLKCSASVGGGLPAIESIKRISDSTPVKSIEGVLNGTCNFVLDHLAAGWDFDTAIKAAQDKGFAEADPSYDLSGRDAASKIRILARTAFGANLQDAEVNCQGIENTTTESAQAARAAGREIRLVARCWKDEKRVFAEVKTRELPAEHPLAQVRGESNRLCLVLESGEELIVSGKGAGRWPTSESVFADLMEIFRYRIGTKKA